MGNRESRLKETPTVDKSADDGNFTVIATPELIESLRNGSVKVNSQPTTLEEAYQKGVRDAFEHAKQQKEAAEAKAWEAEEKVAEKRETAEARRVSELVQGFSSRIVRPPSRPIKCADAEDAVIKCYEEKRADNGDVLECSPMVAALEECAKNALQELVKKKA
uniref:Uncharacterized protein n=1 Tax=Heterosigma akashiwo TaxID=2829 RepID=A0A7S3UWJ8_HETAK